MAWLIERKSKQKVNASENTNRETPLYIVEWQNNGETVEASSLSVNDYDEKERDLKIVPTNFALCFASPTKDGDRWNFE